MSNRATAYGVFFTAPYKLEITSVTEVHSVAGSDGSAVTVQVEKLADGDAKDAGDDILSAGFDLKGTADTIQTGTLLDTVAKVLEKGERLGLVTSGTLTAVENVVVKITWIPRGQGHFRTA